MSVVASRGGVVRGVKKPAAAVVGLAAVSSASSAASLRSTQQLQQRRAVSTRGYVVGSTPRLSYVMPRTLLSSSSTVRRGMATNAKPKLFSKILIANRGEIACRVIRTCKALGIKTVAIFSEPDRHSVHVKMADEAVCVGPAASSQSYLSIPNIIEAVKQTGAEAVHPGYGFLSENRLFQEALDKIGVKFIGPGTHAIQAMGDKISSKLIAKEAGVNIIPGFLGAINSDEELLRISREIGFPVMIKASAGGGGKGMRIAYDEQEALDGYRLSKQEAKSSFGDDTMFVEKFIEEPRHIEIQLLMDAHGNGVYLNERECSIQRRNQKVIEEAPSVFLDAATRKAMGEQAVALAKAVKYESAGTCEFLVDKHRNFYFLEMNTRLQVEHPVTELITGLDLVEHMIRIAAGHPLPFTQADVKLNGWAFESRVYAEDPLRGFLPSIGKLVRYVEPVGENIRCDSGVREGSEISIHYDPMICKLITYGKDRNAALARMREALDAYVIRGVTHNINFLRSLCDHPRFIAGNLTTKFIPDEYPNGYHGAELTAEDRLALVASAIAVRARLVYNQLSVSGQFASFDRDAQLAKAIGQLNVGLHEVSFDAQVDEIDASEDEIALQLRIRTSGGGSSSSSSSARATTVTVSTSYQRGNLVFSSSVNGKTYTMQAMRVQDGSPMMQLQYAGTSFPLLVQQPLQRELAAFMPVKEVVDTSKLVLSPMPGAVFSVKVKAGDHVVAGQEVCVLEAMKMQNALRVVANGVVRAVHVKAGQTVAADQVLVELE